MAEEAVWLGRQRARTGVLKVGRVADFCTPVDTFGHIRTTPVIIPFVIPSAHTLQMLKTKVELQQCRYYFFIFPCLDFFYSASKRRINLEDA